MPDLLPNRLRDPVLEEVVRLAALVCRAPTAWLAWSDGSGIGSPPDGAEGFVEAQRDAPGVLVVPDAEVDPRFAGSAQRLAGGGPLRFYAGLALRDPDGRLTGTLAVADPAPHPADEGVSEGLLSLGRQVTACLARQPNDDGELALRSAALEHSLNGFDIVDTAGRIVYANQAYLRMWGYDSLDEIVGSSPVGHCADPSVPDRIIGDLLAAGENTIAFTALRKDGSTFEVLMASRAFSAPSGRTLFLSTSLDVTEARRAEAALQHTTELLRQSQKMEAIGLLSGGVAHDFNNLLTIVQCHVSLLAGEDSLPSSTRESVEQIRLAAERASDLTRKLLTFSRQQAIQRQDIDLCEVTTQMVRLLTRILGEQVALGCTCPEGGVPVHADPGMIEQVLVNLCVNARDAMPRGGRLRVELGVVWVERDATHRHPTGRFACLAVTDEGVGIRPELLPRIFEPFYTTKEVGQGTGLGLATVYGIVRQHDGWVEVDSAVDRGTTFRVYLPTRDGPTAVRPSAAAASVERGGETVLCVEDEPALRILVQRILIRQGYRVFSAASARDALDLWTVHGPEVDLLLTDVVMPGEMDGFELAACLERMSPRLGVVYTSGYSARAPGGDTQLQEGVNFVSKPFDPETLARVVRAALDRGRVGLLEGG